MSGEQWVTALERAEEFSDWLRGITATSPYPPPAQYVDSRAIGDLTAWLAICHPEILDQYRAARERARAREQAEGQDHGN